MDYLFFLYILIVAVAAFLWWFVPWWQTKAISAKENLTPKAFAELSDQYRKTFTQALTGAVVVLTAIVAFGQLRQTARNAEIQFREDRLLKGFTLLEKTSVPERAAGIQILREWALSQDNDEQGIANKEIIRKTLALFIKENAKIEIPNDKTEPANLVNKCWKTWPQRVIETTVYEAVDALRILSKKGGKYKPLDLSSSFLRKADFSETDLSGSNFAYSNLEDSKFDNATLEKADFYCANFYRSQNLRSVSWQGANLIGVSFLHTNLSNSDFNSACLIDANFVNANLSGVSFLNTDLGHTNWSYTNVTGVRVSPQTQVKQACFVGTNTASTFDQASDFNQVALNSKGDLEVPPVCKSW